MSTNKVRGMVLKLGTRVEVRGTEVSGWICWHNAIVLKIRCGKRLIHIKYEEKLDEGKNVEEHVVYDRVRPIAPELGLESCVPGTLVEARNCGWWTGMIKQVNKRTDKYLVYFSHFGCAKEFEKNNIRVQQDWFVAPHKKKYAWHIKEEMVANLSDTTVTPLVETSAELLGKKDVTISDSESQSESSSHRVQDDANPTLAMLLKEVQAKKHVTHPQHNKSLLQIRSPQIKKHSRMINQPSTHQLQLIAYRDLLQVLMAKYETGIGPHLLDLLSRCCNELQINLTEHADIIQQHLGRQQNYDVRR